MKKLVALLLVLGMMLSACVAYAINIDLSKYSDAELVELVGLLNQALIDRKIVKKATLSAGEYIVGEDIPVGKYTMTALDASSFMGTSVYIYKDNSNTTLGNTKELEYLDQGQQLIVNLEKGNVVSIDGNVTLEVFTGVKFQ